MKLHTVFITYNRLELTKRAIASYLETASFPFLIVDNGSTDGTLEWAMFEGWPTVPLEENRYPGYACNRGWEMMYWPDTEFLHRADNDFAFLPGWRDEIEHIFQNPKVGQVGLRTDAEDEFSKSNTGGNCVIRRELWDKGLRYDETPWPELRLKYGDGITEDSFFSSEVRKLGYTWTRVKRPCIQNLASGDWKDPYYVESYGIRGIRPRREDPTVPADWTGGYST